MTERYGMSHRLRGDWPFPARKTPFFYGWVIAVISTLGFLLSVPGQTMGMAVFADAFIEITGLSRTELSLAYMLGTISSALFLTRAGRFYDEYGPRLVLVSASLLLGASVIFISLVDVISLWLTDLLGINTIAVTFCLMIVGYFGVRFSGQGVMTSVAAICCWFGLSGKEVWYPVCVGLSCLWGSRWLRCCWPC